MSEQRIALLICCSILYATCVSAKRTSLEHVQPKLIQRANDEWIYLGAVDPEEPLQFHIALKQRNVHNLERELMLISDPDSEHYGIHESYENTS